LEFCSWNGKRKSSETAELNSLLEKTRAQFVNCYHELVLEKQKITPDAIKKKFYGIEESEQTLMCLIKYHNDRMDENLEWGTQKNYFTTEKYIFEFLNDKLKKKIFHLVNSTIDLSMILNTF
jgi:hypothetical protein